MNDIQICCVYWAASCRSGGFSIPPPSPPDRHLHPHPAITVGLPKDCLPFGQYLQFLSSHHCVKSFCRIIRGEGDVTGW